MAIYVLWQRKLIKFGVLDCKNQGKREIKRESERMHLYINSVKTKIATFFHTYLHQKPRPRQYKFINENKTWLFYSVPRGFSLFHMQILRVLTFALTGIPLNVASFSPFISLGISVSGSLFGGSKGNHTSPLTVSNCVDDIYTCLSVWLFFFFSVSGLWGVSISLYRTS